MQHHLFNRMLKHAQCSTQQTREVSKQEHELTSIEDMRSTGSCPSCAMASPLCHWFLISQLKRRPGPTKGDRNGITCTSSSNRFCVCSAFNSYAMDSEVVPSRMTEGLSQS